MRIFRDEKNSGVQKAVYWTEYVIRHKGAKHLKNPIFDAPFWKYYMLDVFGLIILILGIVSYLFYKIVKFCFYFLLKKNIIDKIHTE